MQEFASLGSVLMVLGLGFGLIYILILFKNKKQSAIILEYFRSCVMIYSQDVLECASCEILG